MLHMLHEAFHMSCVSKRPDLLLGSGSQVCFHFKQSIPPTTLSTVVDHVPVWRCELGHCWRSLLVYFLCLLLTFTGLFCLHLWEDLNRCIHQANKLSSKFIDTPLCSKLIFIYCISTLVCMIHHTMKNPNHQSNAWFHYYTYLQGASVQSTTTRLASN